MDDLAPSSRVTLQPFCRLHEDRVRGRTVLLAPERVLYPCPTSITVLNRLDGRSLDAVADGLAAEFTAPKEVILKDVLGVLKGLADQGFLRETP